LISLLLITISKIIHRDIKNIKSKHKIQKGKIAYSDLNKQNKPFFSKCYRITGKPDYIVMKDNNYIPVEVKTGINIELQKNHIFQLAAYCHLLEENYGGFVPYGILVYNDINHYKIPFNPKIRFEFESTLKNMRYTMKTGNITRNHSDYNRCRGCSMRTYCNMKII
jgi:CRISPR-associated protein Cas4